MSVQDQPPVRVLIADESLEWRSVLSRAVATTPGFVVAGVEASGDALEFVISLVRPHLLLLDARLGSSGDAMFARHLRHHHPDVVIVLLSATGTDPTVGIEDKRDVSSRWLADVWQRRRRRAAT